MVQRTRIVEQTPHFAPGIPFELLQGFGDLLLCPHPVIELSVSSEQGQGRCDPLRGGFDLHRLVKGALRLAPRGPCPPGHRCHAVWPARPAHRLARPPLTAWPPPP